ncbi:MAG: hypothetical protein B0D87_03525, partial [Candidatus Sedimenticola endophacoides]
MFRSLFGRAQASEPTADEGGHFVTLRPRISALLDQAAKSHTLMSASLKGLDHPCNTAILEVSESEGYLLLDELTPRRGHQQLLEQGRLHLLGRLNGVELSFATELIETDEKEGIAIYKTTLPEKLFYLQRRMDHRVATSGQRIPFRARRGRELEVLIEGYLLDLSQSGIGVILNEDQFLRKGETLANCSIRLPGEEEQPANFAMEIRFYSQGQQSRRGRLGGRFKGLDRETLRRIRQFLNKLERTQIRRQRG